MQRMRTCVRTTALVAAALALLATPAVAHPGGHAGVDLVSGLVHPFGGADHLLAMIGVGLLAARAAGVARWAIPAGFVAFMLLGGVLGWIGVGLHAALIEWAIAGSVVVIGATVCVLPRVGGGSGAAIVVGGFAAFHGYAHAAEMGAASPSAFLGGMLLGTALLHAAGLVGGLALRRAGDVRAVRVAGASLGLAFLVALGVGA